MFKKKTINILSNMKKLNTFMVFACFACLMTMLVSTNYANSQNLQRTELNKQIRTLEDNLRIIDATISELQSTERLENESKKLDLVKVQTKDTYYLAAKDEKVALR